MTEIAQRNGTAQYRTRMATLDNVARMAAELAEVTEGERHGNRTWFVCGKAFAWDRPFSKACAMRLPTRGWPALHRRWSPGTGSRYRTLLVR